MKKRTAAVKYTALVGIMAAILECAKLALAALPNIEAVSLLIALFSYVFGWTGLLASIVFVCIEPLVWGMGTWFVSYLIYWPALSLVFLFLGKARMKNRYLHSLVITLLTFLFGILTSFVDVGLFSGSFENIFYRFGIYYLRGVGFYIVHIVSNALVFLLVFSPLSSFLLKIRKRYF